MRSTRRLGLGDLVFRRFHRCPSSFPSYVCVLDGDLLASTTLTSLPGTVYPHLSFCAGFDALPGPSLTTLSRHASPLALLYCPLKYTFPTLFPFRSCYSARYALIIVILCSSGGSWFFRVLCYLIWDLFNGRWIEVNNGDGRDGRDRAEGLLPLCLSHLS